MNLKDQRSRFATALSVAAAGLLLASPLAHADGGEGSEGDEGGEGEGGGGGISGYGDSAQIEITGKIEPECKFTTPPINASVAMTAGATSAPKLLGFTCNMATSSTVTIKVSSESGGLMREGGAETVGYKVHWLIQGAPHASGFAADWRSPPHQFSLQSGTNGNQEAGDFFVEITGSIEGKPAGTYRDTLTYEICP